MIPGVLAGTASMLLSWVSWWGPVENLSSKAKILEEQKEQLEVRHCHICGGEVESAVLQFCPHGYPVHQGCYQARIAVYKGPAGFCQVCSQRG